MEEINKTNFTEDAVERIQNGRILHYMNKENRDRAFLLIKNVGLRAKRTTSGIQRIHPEYIEDYTGKIETGFGNSMYDMFFKTLYNLEIISEYDKRFMR